MRLTVKARLSASILITSLLLLGGALMAILFSYYQLGLMDAWAHVEDMARDAEDDAHMDMRGRLIIDNNAVMYSEGITVVYMDAAGALLGGAYPLSFPEGVKIAAGENRRVSGSPSDWLVRDMLSEDGFYVRAVMSLHELEGSLLRLALVAGVLTLAFALAMSVLAWLMARHAFLPVNRLICHADTIRSGGQLDERLPVPDTHDEIAALARTFNAMLERLDESFRAERQFTSDVSHELRTPVGAIIAQCEMGLAGEDGDRVAALESIRHTADHMATLVNRLLMLARADQGRQAVQVEPLDIRELCEFACESLAERAQEAGVELTMLPGDAAPQIDGDSALIVSLISNLIGNAINYSDPAKPERHVRVSVSGAAGEARICVEDNGLGIAPEHIKRIFDRFYRVDGSRGGEGTGLGLCLCAWIARAHGGRIEVVSQPGAGSSFTALLTGARGTVSAGDGRAVGA